MLGKENAIALPAVLLYADLLRRPADEPRAALLRRRAPAYAGLVAAAVAFVGTRRLNLGALTPTVDLLDNPLAVLPALPRLLTAVHVIGMYALRLAVPLRLSADYSYDQIAAVRTPLDPGFLAGAAVIVTVVALAAWAWRRLPALALGLGVLALGFALVSNLVVTIGTIMGERLLYLPSIGFCLALAAALERCAGGRASHDARWPAAFVAPLALVVALDGARTVARNAVWHDALGLATALVGDAPRSARSHSELGSALAEAGRLDDANREFERALAIRGDEPTILYNWGVALMQAGRYDAAAHTYRRAIAVKPNFGEAFENLGNVESARGDQQAALAALRRAQELTPESPYLLTTIAAVLARAGAIAEARATYAKALAERPTDPVVRDGYAAFVRTYGDEPAPPARTD
jgi:Flp pilus assembly protein TadD